MYTIILCIQKMLFVFYIFDYSKYFFLSKIIKIYKHKIFFYEEKNYKNIEVSKYGAFTAKQNKEIMGY